MRNWIRNYQIIAGVPGHEGFKISSIGNPHPLRVSFDLEKADTQSSNTGSLTIYNLNDEHKAVLNAEGCYVQILAGYSNAIGTIFAGGISDTEEDISDTDRSIKVNLIDGFINNDIPGSVSLNGDVTCRQAMEAIVSQMEYESAVVSDEAAKLLDAAHYSNGYVFVGKLRAGLQNIVRKAGCTFSCQNGVLQVFTKDSPISSQAYELDAEHGLIGVPKKISISDTNTTKGKSSGTSSTSSTKKSGSKGTTKKGIPGYQINFLINPAIGVNDLIMLKSKVKSGAFRVHKLSIKADNYTDDWTCTAEILEVGKS